MKKALFIFSILTSFNCMAEPIKNISYHYYDVPPTKGEGLKDAAFRVTPIRQNGKKFLGYTHWRTIWNYNYKTDQRGCFITKLTLTANIQVTLPKLTKGTAEQQQIFNAYLVKLKAHELNHVKLALQYITKLEPILQQIKPQPNCRQLERMINNTANQTIKASQQANDAYDRKTNHGATEGATLKNI